MNAPDNEPQDRRHPRQYATFGWSEWVRFTLSALLGAVVAVYALGQRQQSLLDRLDALDHYGSQGFQTYRDADQTRWEAVHLDLQNLNSGQRQLHADLQAIIDQHK